jgi:hypothetical protein
MSFQCFVRNCRFSDKHYTENHKCGRCGQYGHGRMECGHPDQIKALITKFSENCMDNQSIKTEFAVREGKKILGNVNGKIFAVVYAGMGCQWFVKRDSPNGLIDTFFMHTDAWGQYGPQSDDSQKLVNFLSGYVYHEDGKPFTLPSL